MLVPRFSACALLCFSFAVEAVQASCFALAETYYEQLYCEVKEEAPSTVLPAFVDFKKNNEQMQALLLKRKAEALGISVKMPATAREANHRDTSLENHPENPFESAENLVQQDPQATAACQFSGQGINCSGTQFLLTGNKPNSKIPPTALHDKNRLTLNNYSGDLNDHQALILFLTNEYTHYLEKMLEIGLGGATMSFTKFYTLFLDIRSKGGDFASRFETMYQFLKKDKLTIGVSGKTEMIAGISMADCARLTDDMFTCDNQRRNSIYLKQ
jgi:hypothetical protein